MDCGYVWGMMQTTENSDCKYCGLANPRWAHRGSLRCRYLHDQRKMRNLGLVQVSINCQPLLVRLGIPYDVAIGNYHVGSRGCKGFTTSACFVAPSVKAALATQGRKSRDHAVRIAAGLPSVAPRSIRYLHPKLPKLPHTPEYQPGAGISEAMALHNNCCKAGIARIKALLPRGTKSISWRQAYTAVALTNYKSTQLSADMQALSTLILFRE